MRTTPLLATGLLAASALLATPTAYAAGETCQGQPATIVGTPGQFGLTGTEGADVIVTNGATSVSALGGDDLVCVTGGTPTQPHVVVDAGAGDDVVDASASGSDVWTALGTGSDTYTGSPHGESVYAGTNPFATGTSVDTEPDVVTTGAGGTDLVFSGSDRTVLNSDTVVLSGGGGRLTWVGPLAAGGRLDGGGGSKLDFTVGSGAVVVDAVSGTMSQDGALQLRWTGFDRYRTGGAPSGTPSSFSFVGSDRDEELELDFADAHTVDQRIDLGGGDDNLWMGAGDSLGSRGSRYIGGPGKDHALIWGGTNLDVDLAQERIKRVRSGTTFRSTFTGFESQLVGARKLVLTGTPKADALPFRACRATVRGRGGKDVIGGNTSGRRFPTRLECGTRAFRLFGGRGNDTLRGGTGRDLLVGGPGRDTVFGNSDRDRCSGEKLRSCEIKVTS
ncbi:Ca2+-binding RTX toxin-like protein [Nocardioides sp. BE266]|uniref:hypothetical protein n=1 Tax=Nocardioides sp. BE266 TaxID=2817725 RepID=UPI0028660D26|nr:hypothetical protein [Nocardioides sp. BE266]MDR7253161.1 Ca2+-binding RTX toxin-like protein [Nocardioides sp. BE266]